jgi:hypothetical protein
MKTNNKGGIYQVVAGDPKEEDDKKIFIKDNITFEEADLTFNSLLEKQQYPVILLDEGNTTIRGFKAPGIVEQDYRYTKLKEGLYRAKNPDYQPHYVVMAWEDYEQNSDKSGVQRTVRKLKESDDFGDAYTSYLLYAEHFNDYGSHFDGVIIIDSKSNRLIDTAAILHTNQEETKEPKRKKKEDPGYER